MGVIDPYLSSKIASALSDTWGHLLPDEPLISSGKIITYLTVQGDYGLYDWNFNGIDDSPWFSSSLHEFILYNAPIEPRPNLFVFNGTCTWNGAEFSFSGKWRQFNGENNLV